jgi:cation-transporting P-type ATPase E
VSATLSPSAPGALRGLSAVEAERRLRERGPRRAPPTSRSYASIVRANVFTVFNVVLAAFGAVTLAFGDWRDALFLGVLLANTAIGITQEVRAKHALDRLALLVAPAARVIRDGEEATAGAGELVPGDLVRLQAGDQLLADGTVVRSQGMRLDESILTGESDAVARRPGEEVRSGAFVAEGAGAIEVSAVGEDSYAERLLGEARAFRHPRSPLELAVNRLLFGLLALVVVMGTLLGVALDHRDAGLSDAVTTATAGVISMIPEGLVLLVSLTFAVGAVRMSRRGVLAQQLNAIESLASADVICLDKTGTLTEPVLRVVETVPAGELDAPLARYAAASAVHNATMDAIAAAFPGEPEVPVDEVPFSSARRWSSVELSDLTLVLGAPELFDLGELAATADARRAQGRRVVALGEGPEPSSARTLGLVVLGERLRDEAGEVVAFFRAEGVEMKILSGDAPATVAAIARDAGIAVADAADGRDLPDDPAELEAFAARTTVVGRISPEGKRAFVEALGRSGRHVAMVGDGVNDVPALKAARLAIAQGTGTQIAKSVADLVLVRGDFAAVPELIAEGRQALRNLQRVAKLYVTKSAFAAFLILMIGTTSTAYPLLPRHFSLAATLTIGIPTFFLALAPSSGDWRPTSFVRRVAAFAVPAGVITGTGVVASYLFALHDLDFSVVQARTVATSVLVLVGLYLVLELEATGRRRTRMVGGGCATLAALYALALALRPVREFFALAPVTPGLLATVLVGAALSVGALALAGFSPGAAEDPVRAQRQP